MKIPEKIKIGGHVMSVVVTTDNALIAYNEVGKTQLGMNRIVLNGNYPQSQQEEALLHEVIHNCFYDLNEDQDEKLITRLGVSLYMVIGDNPEVFA